MPQIGQHDLRPGVPLLWLYGLHGSYDVRLYDTLDGTDLLQDRRRRIAVFGAVSGDIFSLLSSRTFANLQLDISSAFKRSTVAEASVILRSSMNRKMLTIALSQFARPELFRSPRTILLFSVLLIELL